MRYIFIALQILLHLLPLIFAVTQLAYNLNKSKNVNNNDGISLFFFQLAFILIITPIIDFLFIGKMLLIISFLTIGQLLGTFGA